MPKPDLALLIGKPMKGKPMSDKDHGMDEHLPEDDMKDDGSEQKDMEHSAVADFIAAMQSKDVPAATAALKDFLQMCDHSEPDGDEEEPMEE